MNKNTDNDRRKGTHRSQLQNKRKGENEIHGGERDEDMSQGKDIHRINPSADYNVFKENEIPGNNPPSEQNENPANQAPRTKPWSPKKNLEEQKIYPVESSGEMTQPREKETHRMVSWNKEHKDREREISPFETVEGNIAMSAVKILEDKSQASKEKKSLNGYKATRIIKIPNQNTFNLVPPTHTALEDQSSKEDILSAPAMGTVLYTVAVLLVIGWVIGFFFTNAGDLIHVLLVLALIAVLIKVAQGRSD